MVDEVLLLTARVLLRACSPQMAHRIMRGLGRSLPPLTSRAEVQRAVQGLRGPGSCLSRALAIAARSEASEVVIGVEWIDEKFHAHAWLEIDGAPLDPADPRGREIARLAHPAGGGACRQVG
jgi:hypothetical protein